MTENFFSLLAYAFDRVPDRPALLIPGGRDYSYGDLDRMSAELATTLSELGVEVNARVLVQVDKSPQAVALYLGCLRLGAVYVPINTAYTEAEVAYFLEDARPALFVCGIENEADLARLALSVDKATAVRSLGVKSDGSLMDSMDGRSSFAIAPRDASDIAAILYTSGTTGRSKGAMLTHGNLASNSVTLIDYWGWQDDDVLLHALPIFHVHGLFIALHCAMLKASPMIFLNGFDAATVIPLLPQATVMMGVPTFYTRLLGTQELDRDLCRGMRLFISGSAPLTAHTFEAWERRTGHRILERYGMSETMMNTSNPLLGDRQAGTVGFALPGVSARIASESGEVLPAGEIGVIEVKGSNVFAGYWQMPEKTAAEFRDDGYFITGDLATMDASGRISIVGREKDLVISGGYNIYPKEIEILIDEIPVVLESAVIGVPHPDFGEGVVAVVVPRTDAVTSAVVDEVLRDKVARFKQPKVVVNVAELPRNAMGKVQKNRLREQFSDLFENTSSDTSGNTSSNSSSEDAAGPAGLTKRKASE
jgi:malonyl-CoA/methylmalonyl-CoA synthetase